MKIIFPQKTIRHKVPANKTVEPVFLCKGGLITWDEAAEIFCQVKKYHCLLDVMSYAENGYGCCNDPAVARKVRHYAADITKAYEDKLVWNEAWFDVLEDTIEEGLR